jgi:hypothetical protein
MRCVLSASLVLGLVLAAPLMARADDDADMKALIEKAIKAHGGAEKLSKNKATTMKFKGKIYAVADGLDYTGEIAVQMPAQVRSDIMFETGGMKFAVVNLVNGDKGWISLNGKTDDMPKEAIDEAKEELYAGGLDHLVMLKEKEFKLSPLGESKVGDKEAVGVKIAHKDHRDVSLYFDKKSGLLLKRENQIKDFQEGGAEKMQESIYDDYKDIDGIQHPMKLLIKRDGKNYVDAEVSDVKVLDKLDDKTFDKP